MKTWGRKAFIYLITLVILVVVGFFMAENNYSTFAHNAIIMAIGFFSGNAVEHIAGALKK